MDPGDDWDSEKMLDLYLHDYLIKNNLHETAALFRMEAGISNPSVDIDSPQGFLREWWSLFYDIFASREPQQQEHSDAGSSSKPEIQEEQAQNFGPITFPRSRINQQRTEHVPIPGDFGSGLQLLVPDLDAGSSSLPQQLTNLALHQVQREQSQGIGLGITIPVNPNTLDGAQKGKLPITEPPPAGFSFRQFGCIYSNEREVLCCHFSSDGKYLACAGHEKKVWLWNMETLELVKTSESHSLPISDVRFRPNSTMFATSSFDHTIRIWDAAKLSKSLFDFVGHAEQVLSIDFHPMMADLLCSCDSNGQMRLWDINQRSCMHVFKGATKQVRFQPLLGKLIATASGNVVNVIDFETSQPLFCLKGHNKEVLSICWDPTGKYISTVSEDGARVWSVSGGECLHELRSTGNKFQCCTFHPANPQFLVIGGYESIEVWNPVESNQTWKIEAHKGLISSLAASPRTEMFASASHDRLVKIWK